MTGRSENIMNYKEASKLLMEMQRSNELIFRFAISHLMDVGIRHLTDENVEYTCEEIMKQDDSHSIMTNEFQCEIVRAAAKIAKIEHTLVLAYIAKNIKYDVGLEGLKTDEPMKVELKGDGYDDNGNLYYEYAYCPVCEHEYEVDYDYYDKFCRECGQALDWSEVAEN